MKEDEMVGFVPDWVEPDGSAKELLVVIGAVVSSTGVEAGGGEVRAAVVGAAGGDPGEPPLPLPEELSGPSKTT